MKIQTFSVVVGTKACNASCPFCVSKMTGFGQLPKVDNLNIRNLKKALMMAHRHEAESILMTGKGEPTLYPEQILMYLYQFEHYDCQIPVIEMQTNGLAIGRLIEGKKSTLSEDHLKEMFSHGLDVIALSVVDICSENNQKVYHKDYPSLEKTISYLRKIGFQVRLCVMMQNKMVDSPDVLRDVIDFCKKNDVFQLTIRAIRKPKETESTEASDYVSLNGLSSEQFQEIYSFIEKEGNLIRTLIHGAKVYDFHGQNICFADCLTVEGQSSDIRTLIYYPTGEISYDWQFKGARLL